MKKLTVLFFILAISISFAQLNKEWELVVGGPTTPTWLANDNSTRGMDYDAVNNYLFVCSRTGGHNIYVLNADNGTVLDTLDMTGVTGGTYNLNLVKVAEDGVIYACNLALANGVLKIYRWQNKDAVPTVAYTLNPAPGRYGDAFKVVGSGNNTIIYISGTDNTKISLLTTTNGTDFTLNKEITLPAGYKAGGSICPENNTLNSNIWINQSGNPIGKIDKDGAIIDSVSGGVISSGWRNLIYYVATDNKFLGVAGKNDPAEGKKMALFNIDKGSYFPRPASYGELGLTYNANANATADFAFRTKPNGQKIIYNLVSNNGIAAYIVAPVVYFSVNMRIKTLKGDFNPAEDKLWVRGGFNGWGQSDTMRDTDNDTIYTAVVKLDTFGTKEFKFMYRDVSAATDKWEDDPNRSVNFNKYFSDYNGGYFNKDSLLVTRDTIYTYFSVNMELERLSGRFNPATDSVSVNGSFQGWSALKNLLLPSTLNPDIYEGTFAIFAGVGEEIEFKFFYKHGSQDVWESVSNRKYMFTQTDFDTKTAVIQGAFNNGSLETVINQPCAIKFTVNMNGAVNFLTGQPFTTVTTVHIAGSSTPLQWPSTGWPNSDSTKVIQLFDDGTHGDVLAGDKIFTNILTFPRYTVLETKYKYAGNWGLSSNGGGNDNESGFGGDHTLRMTKDMVSATAVDTFGKASVTSLRDIVTGIEEEQLIPTVYELSQNYPNPFNPSTVINYTIPKSGMVEVKVFDMLGREIMTLVNEQKNAGKYSVTFDASKLSSGMYLYSIKANDFTATKKMLFVK